MTLATLIHIAPYDDETKARIESLLGSLTPDQEAELTELSWEMIGEQFRAEIEKEQDLYFLDVQEGAKQYNEEEFKNIPDKLAFELTKKLEDVGNDTEIEAVKKQLVSYGTSPSSTQTTAQPPSAAPSEVVAVNAVPSEEEIPADTVGYARPKRPEPFRSTAASSQPLNGPKQETIVKLTQKLHDLQSQMSELTETIAQLQNDKNN